MPIDTRGLCYKTDYGRNLRLSDRKYVYVIKLIMAVVYVKITEVTETLIFSETIFPQLRTNERSYKKLFTALAPGIINEPA